VAFACASIAGRARNACKLELVGPAPVAAERSGVATARTHLLVPRDGDDCCPQLRPGRKLRFASFQASSSSKTRPLFAGTVQRGGSGTRLGSRRFRGAPRPIEENEDQRLALPGLIKTPGAMKLAMKMDVDTHESLPLTKTFVGSGYGRTEPCKTDRTVPTVDRCHSNRGGV